MPTTDAHLLVVGAGHAGSELAIAARQQGWQGAITLLGDETQVPYHRPPLSKAWLTGQVDEEGLWLRPPAAYDNASIVRRTGARMTAIDRAERRITLANGETLGYSKLALCTGGRPRPWVCAGLDPAAPPPNLHVLRCLQDAEGIRQQLRPGARLLVIGGGYVGLEVAASARKLGAHVTLLEMQPRVLARVAGPELSAFYERKHRAEGVDLRTGKAVTAVQQHDGRIASVTCDDGQVLAVDLVVAGLGMLANTQAAQAAGLGDAEGIDVDELSRTRDPHIVAAGDCTRHASARYGRVLRVESVPNALEQARAAASWLVGQPKPHRAPPWFWSDQYGLKLQMVGLSQGYERCVLRGDPEREAFSAFYLRGNALLAVDAVNRPADFMLAKRLLAGGCSVDVARLADEALPLKVLLQAAPA
jgi:3-phenylpropionate/trans-cinnamate dioxygenase ferredoxin reductase subunit